jgi:hypothetical protein
MPPNFRSINYLKLGSAEQSRAFDAICQLQVLTRLGKYDPVLVSAICLDIGTAKSDLDIICEVYDHDAFITEMTQLFGNELRFSWRKSSLDPSATIICFTALGFEFELFGKSMPVEKQSAFRHIYQVARIIDLGGERFRGAIRDLKNQGLKTEPAVARLLGLSGDPYQAVLDLEHLSDAALGNKLCLLVF